MIRYINPPKPDEPLIASLATPLHNGLMSMVDKQKVNNVNYSDNTLHLQDFYNGGIIGIASTTIDVYKSIVIKQDTPNQEILLPTPTNTDNILYLLLSNVGTNSFLFYNVELNVNNSIIVIWNTVSWNIAASYSNISNLNKLFITSNYTIEKWNSFILVDSSNDITITLPASQIDTQSQIIIICNTVGNVSLVSNQYIFPINSHTYNNIFNHKNQSILIMSLSDSCVVTSPYHKNFQGSTPTLSGISGLVPAPLVEDMYRYLRGDGYWTDVNSSSIVYLGEWDAINNVPIIQNGIGVAGSYYKVGISGNTTINQITNWHVGDWIIFNGTNWDKINNSSVSTSLPHTWQGNNTNAIATSMYNNMGSLSESPSSVLAIVGGSHSMLNNVTIEVKKSSDIQSGYLSYIDWTRFNNKLDVIVNGTINNFTTIDVLGKIKDSTISYTNDKLINDNNVILSSSAIHNNIKDVYYNLHKPLSIWNATLNKPELNMNTGIRGFCFYVSVSGYQSGLSGLLTYYNVGDIIIYNKDLQWIKL